MSVTTIDRLTLGHKLADRMLRVRAARERHFERSQQAKALADATLDEDAALVVHRRWEERDGNAWARESRAKRRLGRFILRQTGFKIPSFREVMSEDVGPVALRIGSTLWLVIWESAVDHAEFDLRWLDLSAIGVLEGGDR
jgi:hypothetical protein